MVPKKTLSSNSCFFPSININVINSSETWVNQRISIVFVSVNGTEWDFVTFYSKSGIGVCFLRTFMAQAVENR